MDALFCHWEKASSGCKKSLDNNRKAFEIQFSTFSVWLTTCPALLLITKLPHLVLRASQTNAKNYSKNYLHTIVQGWETINKCTEIRDPLLSSSISVSWWHWIHQRETTIIMPAGFIFSHISTQLTVGMEIIAGVLVSRDNGAPTCYQVIWPWLGKASLFLKNNM